MVPFIVNVAVPRDVIGDTSLTSMAVLGLDAWSSAITLASLN